MSVSTVVVGAGIEAQVRPPSVVRSIAAHRLDPHGTRPRTQPWSAETNVTDTGSKPTGADVGAGLAAAGLADGTTGDGTVDEEAPDEGIALVARTSRAGRLAGIFDIDESTFQIGTSDRRALEEVGHAEEFARPRSLPTFG